MDRFLQEGDVKARVHLVRKLFKALDECGVDWVIRGLPGELFRWCRAKTRKDLDIWVPLQDVEKCVSVAVKQGGIPVCSRKGYLGRTWLRTVIFIYISTDGKALAMLDFNFGPPGTGLINLSNEAYYTNSVVRRNGWPYLSGGPALMDIFVRRLVRGKQFTSFWVSRLREIWKGMDHEEKEKWRVNIDHMFNHYVVEQLHNILDGNMEEPSRGWTYFHYYMLLVYFSRRPISLVGSIWDRMIYGIPPRRRNINPAGAKPSPVTVAVIGTDGTGKSTLTSILHRNTKGFSLACERLYFGRVRGGVLLGSLMQRIFSLCFGNKEGDAPAVKVSKSMSNSEKIARWIGSYYYVFDYLSRFLFLVLPRMFKGYVIIYDRYVYDLYIMPGASKYAAWLIERLAPRPQIVCFLDVNAEAIISRRAERTMEEAKRQQIILGNVTQRVAKGRTFVNVPGSVDAKTSAKQITRICIMQALRKQIKNKTIISMLIKDAKSRLEEK